LSLRRVTRPLQALVTEGQRVAEGGDFHPLSLEGPPDLRVLLDIVNQMVARLSEQQETLRRYARRILQGQEDERKRLSRELHDETVQDLVALNQRIELTHNALERDPQEAQTRLAELQSLAQRAVTEVRRMSNNLRPSILEDLGLAPALQTLTGELMQAAPGIQANCEIVGAETRLPPDLELVAYRIAQEALNNIRRHAKTATRVNVALFYEGWGIMLMIEDDGPGFEPEELPESGHLGLVGMKERAQIFGGELKIQAAPGEGTTVALRLPTNNKTPGLV
jgi:signal transduction histidine kinase